MEKGQAVVEAFAGSRVPRLMLFSVAIYVFHCHLISSASTKFAHLSPARFGLRLSDCISYKYSMEFVSFGIYTTISHIERISFALNLNCFMPFTGGIPRQSFAPFSATVVLPSPAKYAKQLRYDSISFSVFSFRFRVYNRKLE